MAGPTRKLQIAQSFSDEAVRRAGFCGVFDFINIAVCKDPEVLAEDIFASGFVVTGVEPSKSVSSPNQIEVSAGACYVRQPDGGLRRFALEAASFAALKPLTTYYLDLEPDGTYSWDTVHSAQAGYLSIAEVATDSEANVAAVIDKRPLAPGIGKVNADLVRNRNIVAEYDAHKHTGEAEDGPRIPQTSIANVPAVRVRHSLDQNIADITPTVLQFDTEELDTDNMYDFNYPTRLTCKTPGLYLIAAHLQWSEASGGVRTGRLRLNGTLTLAENTIGAGVPGRFQNNLLTMYRLNAGDYIEVVVYQNSGYALNVVASEAHTPVFMMVRHGD